MIIESAPRQTLFLFRTFEKDPGKSNKSVLAQLEHPGYNILDW
jgi:hypothetical protein